MFRLDVTERLFQFRFSHSCPSFVYQLLKISDISCLSSFSPPLILEGVWEMEEELEILKTSINIYVKYMDMKIYKLRCVKTTLVS